MKTTLVAIIFDSLTSVYGHHGADSLKMREGRGRGGVVKKLNQQKKKSPI